MDKQLEMLMLRIVTLPDSHQGHAIERLARALEAVERHAAEYECRKWAREFSN